MARKNTKHLEWYAKTRTQYQSLSEIVAATLKVLLKNSEIDFVDIPHRAKTIESFQGKILRKKYKDPKSEMMDLAGIRVITYIENDVKAVADLIESSFNIHKKDSGDKSDALGQDRFGYRSVHYVCDIGQAREGLPEFAPYKGMLFEIQIRTALQHAWAEIEHDRSYKFDGELPSKIKRRFHLVAGLLELADREFNELTVEIDNYSKLVHERAGAGNLDIELNSLTVLEYLRLKINGTPLVEKVDLTRASEEVIEELRIFGIDRLSDLDSIFTEGFMEASVRYIEETNAIGFLRDAMMYGDLSRYFDLAWRKSWGGIDAPAIEMLTSKYGKQIVDRTIKDNSLDLLDEEGEAEY